MESESERSDKTRVDGSVVLSTALSLSSTTTTEEAGISLLLFFLSRFFPT